MQPNSTGMNEAFDANQQAILEELRRQIGVRRFEHWFDNKTTLQVSGDHLTVGVASPFFLNWIPKQFRSVLQRAAETVLGPSAHVSFEVDARVALAEKLGTNGSSPAAPPATRDGEPALELPMPRKPAHSFALPGRHYADLADFVGGKCNELALTAARHITDQPGSRINPLFVHGGVGVGKTHLLEGVYREIRRRYPELQVAFLTAETFANYFTQALRAHSLPSFRQRFRNVGVLLVDDVDFFAGKRVIEEEFLHTFTQLESHGRQLVLASDRHPRLLPKVSEELSTRFLSGVVCRIEPPELETRIKILERKAKRLQGDIAPEALRFVAQQFKNNVRELEGALNCLCTYQSMTRKRVTLTAARDVLADLERDCQKIVRMADVEQVVCSLFGVTPKDLKSPTRTHAVSRPRMLAMFLARKHTQSAFSEIGRFFGGRNHSTVMSAHKKVAASLTKGDSIQVMSQIWPLAEVIETLEQHLLAC